MFESLFRYLEQHEGPLGYLVLGGSAALEYLIPPFPGDTITLFGTFLATSAGYSVIGVYLVLTLGSILGGLGTYAVGRSIGEHEDRWPGFLRRPRVRRAIERIRGQFVRHGPAYLTLNRFIPAVRGVIFLAAGVVKVPLDRVVLFGTISAALWNAVILGAGYSVGRNWERLSGLGVRYTLWAIGAIAVVAVAFAVRAVWRRRRRPSRAADHSE